VSTEHTYYVWITTITDSYTEQLVGRLIRRNWKISALGNNLSLRNSDNLATLVAFSMSKVTKDKDEEMSPSKALDELKDILKRLDIKYHTLVVTQPGGCTWTLGNVTKSLLEKEQLEFKKIIN